MSSLCQCEGPPCLEHPNYTFYQSFKYNTCNNGSSSRTLTCGDFFFLHLTSSAPLCIGELELVWRDVASNQLFVSVKLYFRPEHTPEGRQDETGEDEVIALRDRLVVRLDDLVPRIHHDVKWTYGSCAYSSRAGHVLVGCEKNRKAHQVCTNTELVQHENGKKRNFGVDISEKANMDTVCDSACSGAANVLVLTYPKYCRYRAMQKRLEGSENEWLHLAVVAAIGGLSGKCSGCRIMFCRETFSQTEYDDLSMKMDHMLPILKEPIKGKKCRQSQKDSQHDSDSMEENCFSTSCPMPASSRPRRSVESSDANEEKVSTEEQAFLIGLHKFMHDAQMPIGRIPSLGFKQIDLYFFYKQAERLGGYEMITDKRMWKRLYDQLGGNSSNTSAATCTRKHYERLLLPYERHLNKIKMSKTKKKLKKTVEADVTHKTVDTSPEMDVRQEPGGAPLEEAAENGDVVAATTPETEFSNPDLEEKQEMAAEEHDWQDDNETVLAGVSSNMQPVTVAADSSNIKYVTVAADSSNIQPGTVAADSSNMQHLTVTADSSNMQHLTVSETKSIHLLSTSTADVTVVAGEKPEVSHSNQALLPAQPSHVLHAVWPVLTPVVSPSPIPICWSQTVADVLSLPKASVRGSLQDSMPSLCNNQKSVLCTVSSRDNSSKLSSPAVVGQTYQPSSPTGRRAQKLALKDAESKTTPVHLSHIKPAQHILLPSQQLSPNLTISSQNLALMLHPTPAGHHCLQHLPPAPSTIYLHPSATNQLSLLQAPTFPAPTAHCHVRKRAYPFETCTSTAAPGGTFPSPDMVLDRIRNCTSFPVGSQALAKPSSRRQQFDDPRDIFRQIPQAVAASHISSQSIRKEARLPASKQCSSTSGKHSQQLHQPDNSLSSCDSKVAHSMKAASHANGFISSPRSSKSVASVTLCQSPAASNNGRLTSALFGTQFTALPRIAKPSDFSCQSTSLLEPSLPAATAMNLNAHLHPAFVSPFLQTTAQAAPPSSPGLHLLAGTYTTPAQFSAYEEMLRQNGYGRFLTTSTQRKGFKKK